MTLSINDLLEQQQQTLLALDPLIEQELQALIAHDAEQIQALSEQKNQLLQTLQQGDQAIAAHPERSQLLADDPRLVAIRQGLSSCQTRNALLGEVMKEARISLSRLESQLMAIRGKEMMTYDAEGRTRNTSTLGNNVRV